MTIELIPSALSIGGSLDERVAAGRIAAPEPIAAAETVARSPFFIADPIDTAIASFGDRFLDTSDSSAVPATAAYHLTDAVVLGADAMVMLDGTLLRDTARHLPFWNAESAIAAVTLPDGVTLHAPMPVRADGGSGPVLLGGVPTWRNHAHWLQECLPKLMVFLSLRDRLPGLRVAVPRTPAGAVVAGTLRLVGITPADTVLLDAGDAVAFSELILLTEAQLFAVPGFVPKAAAVLADAAADEVALVTVPGSRIYVHRTVEMRPVANFAALQPLLDYYGFAVVSFEGMTLIEQIATMRAARHVIAEHGAGLANMLFCQPGTTVLELFNPACVQPAFWAMASACQHRYGFLVGMHVATSWRPEPDWNAAYDIAPERLEEAIRVMLGEEAAGPLPIMVLPSVSPAGETADVPYGGEETGNFVPATDTTSFARTGRDEYLQLFGPLMPPVQIPALREPELPPAIRAEHHKYEPSPAVRIYALANSVVWGNGLITRGRRFFMPAGTYPPYFRALALRTGGHAMPAIWTGALNREDARRIELDHPVAVALHPNIGYGNLLLEMMAKLYQLTLLRDMGVRFRLCLSRRVGAWARELVGLYFRDDELVLFDGDAEYLAPPGVILPSMMHVDHNFHPAENVVVADAMRRVGATASDVRRLLFVCRIGDERRIENDEAAHSVLADLGFELVRPETMSVAEQIRLFVQAGMIVGEYGPPLHNALFAPPGTLVLALNWIDWYQSCVARLRQQRLGFLPLADGAFHDWRPDKQTGRMHSIDTGLLRSTVLEMMQSLSTG